MLIRTRNFELELRVFRRWVGPVPVSVYLKIGQRDWWWAPKGA